MEGAHEHMEHAEHAGHAHDPFDKRVAVRIAIVAAVLAGVSMLGHRKHNEVLQLTTEANIHHTQATDTWGEYQAVNIRDHGYDFTSGILKEVSKAEPKYAPGLKGYIDKADAQHKKYEKRLSSLKGDAEGLVQKAKDRVEESHYAHRQADNLDYGHLGAEIGIVLCSLALLTKRKIFWLAGLGATVLAIALVISAFTLPHDKHDDHADHGEAGHKH